MCTHTYTHTHISLTPRTDRLVDGQAGGQGLHTSIVFAVIVEHEHDFPLKYVVILDEAARDAREVGPLLHVPELTAKEPRCGGGGAGTRRGHYGEMRFRAAVQRTGCMYREMDLVVF